MQELSLQDRRVFNVLIEEAGPEIHLDKWHEVSLLKLRGSSYKSNERISDSIDRLMCTLVKIPAKDSSGLDAIQTTVLIAENLQTIDETDRRAVLRYKMTETMRNILANSRYWGRLKGFIVFSFSSKYALALYEALCLRVNLQVSEQTFTVEEFRRLLDVGKGKLTGYPQLNQSAIQPAVFEVNGLSDFVVEIEAIRDGGSRRGRLTGFRVAWRRKSKDEWQAALSELLRTKLGRKARLSGTVDQIQFYEPVAT